MRIDSLKVSGFRGFAGEYGFDMSADVVLIYGPNGAGKTSLFDAMLWGLTGSVERLAGGDSVLVSHYSPAGEARVELTLCQKDGERRLRVVRRYDGEQSLLVETESDRLTGPVAEAELLKVLWHGTSPATGHEVSLSRSVARTIYLQQDQVRSFLDEENQQSRFDIVSELFGTGRVRELVQQMERGRNGWTRATTRLKEALQDIEKRRNALRDRIAAMETGGSGASDIDDRWNKWVQDADRVLDRPVRPRGGRVKVIEQVLHELRRAQRRSEHRLGRLRDLVRIATERPRVVLSSEVNEAKRGVAEIQQIHRVSIERLEAAQRMAAQHRQKQIESEQRRESMAALAQLALRHLDKRCPVCTQEYDVDHTNTHLKALLRRGGTEVDIASEDVTIALRMLGEDEQKLAKAQKALREVEASQRTYGDWIRDLSRLASDLGIKETQTDLIKTVQRNLAATTEQIAHFRRIRNRGESLIVDLARISESERLVDYGLRLREIEDEFDTQLGAIKLREITSENAKVLHEALRSVSESLVTAELERVNPLLQQIYSSVDPHPSFRAIDFLSETYRGRGRFWTRVTDDHHGGSFIEPGLVLSSSQMNVLAVVVFLALNLSVPSLPLQTVALDDPLQSLDNINLLGLADLLRRLRNRRQVVIATHDARLLRLLERKLRPVSPQQRTIVHKIDGWTRLGPTVHVRNTPRDHPKVRLLKTG